MQLSLRWLTLPLVVLGASAVMIGAPRKSGGEISHSPGAVFVMTNDATRNEIISYERTLDGLLFVGNRYATEGRGSGGVVDPLQSQGSLALSQDHRFLFAANAGSGTVSVFQVRGAELRLVDQANSGGSEPLSIAQHGEFIYVLNGAAAGAIVVFRWDDRELRQVPNSTVFLTGTSAGGSSVSVRPDGKVLTITERLTNNIDTFAIKGDGSLAPIVVNTSTAPGIFSASFAPNGALLVSETGPANANDASAISSYQVDDNGLLSAVSQSVPTLGNANCWNVVTPNGLFVYASNAGSSTISGFSINAQGVLTPIGPTVLGINPAGSANLDIAVSADSRYLYTLNTRAGAIGAFAIQNDGSLLDLGPVEGLAKSGGLNGIAAY